MQINYATIATTHVDIWNKLKLIKNELYDFSEGNTLNAVHVLNCRIVQVHHLKLFILTATCIKIVFTE